MAELIILMGPTGAGKSVQARSLAAAYGWFHLSTGELLRADAEVSQQLSSGRLVLDEEVERVLEAAIRRIPAEQSVVLDGFPRSLKQAQWIDDKITTWHRHLKRVILIEIDEATSRERLAGRHRNDDTAPAEAAKWQAYEAATLPVAARYEQRGQLVKIDGHGTVAEVADRIKEVLK